jgi:hypothetical protein
MGTIIGSRLSDPLVLGAVAFDYNLSNPSTMQQSVGGGGGNPGNNDRVGHVLDQSGNALHLDAPSSAGRPTFQTAVSGAAGAVLFNGTSQWLERLATSNVSANRSAFTIYAVVKHTNTPTGREPYVLLSFDALNSVRIQHNAAASPANTLSGNLRRANADAITIAAGATPIGTGMRYVTLRADYAADALNTYLNGADEASATIGGASGANTDNTNGRVYVGGQGTAFMDGHIFRVIGFHAAHNADQRAAVWSYLRNIYSIS